MAKTKEQKEKIIKDLAEKIGKQKSIVFIDFSGLDSSILFQLRNELKQLDGRLQIVKKTLLKKALEGLKDRPFIEKIEEIEGQLGLAFGFSDEIAAAKTCYKVSQENEDLKILGGILGKDILTKEKIIELAQIPSQPELLGRLVGTLTAPISGFMNTLRGNIKNLIYVLNAIKLNAIK